MEKEKKIVIENILNEVKENPRQFKNIAISTEKAKALRSSLALLRERASKNNK